MNRNVNIIIQLIGVIKMICKHCGTEIDLRSAKSDGTITCPGCGAVYRHKSSIAQQGTKGSHKSGSQIRAPRTERMRPERDVGRVASQPHLEKTATEQKRRKKKGNLVVVLLLAILIVASSVCGVGIIVDNKAAERDQEASNIITPPPVSSFPDENNRQSGSPSSNNYLLSQTNVDSNPSSANSQNASLSELSVKRQENYIPFHSTNYYLDGRVFNDGVAWASLRSKDNGKTKLGLINTQGEVFFFLDENRFEGKAEDLIATPFINGIAAVYDHGFSGGNHVDAHPGFVIVDREGNILLDNNDDSLYICGQTTDGEFILARHDAGFSGDNWYISLMDSSLNITDTDITCPKSIIHQRSSRSRFLRITDGLYYDDDNRSILNFVNNCYYDMSLSLVYLGEYSAYAIIGNVRRPQTYLMPVEKLLLATSEDQIINMLDNDESCIKYAYHLESIGAAKDNYYYSSFKGMSMYHTTSSDIPIDYLDAFGNTIFSFPVFPEGVKYKKVGSFSGGLAAIFVTGADKKPYVTVIDENGQIQYDPVRCPYSYDDNKISSYNGYVIFDEYQGSPVTIIDPTGKTLKLGDALAIPADSKCYCTSPKFAIGGGYMFFGNAYYALDGSRSFDTIVAKYNENEKLVYTGRDGASHVSTVSITYADGDNNSKMSAPAKTYMSPSRFSIEGKWKNVGTYSFGQVQNGAIVSFDGTNCNFYSPKDTYSFYKNGDHFILDCTSLLFSETLSFEVKIVDDDHIDIYYGSNYLELARTS